MSVTQIILFSSIVFIVSIAVAIVLALTRPKIDKSITLRINLMEPYDLGWKDLQETDLVLVNCTVSENIYGHLL